MANIRSTITHPAGLCVGMQVQDRDPRCPTRSGEIVGVDADTVTVRWNTGKTTTFARRTCLQRFRVL